MVETTILNGRKWIGGKNDGIIDNKKECDIKNILLKAIIIEANLLDI